MSSDNSDYECEAANSGAAHTEQVGVNTIKINSFVMIDDHPCKVIDLQKYKVGKHGHAKAAIKGVDVFTGKALTTHKPTHGMIEIPNVKREILRVLNIEDSYITLQAQNGDIREDIELPANELGEKIKNTFASESVVAGDSEILVTVMEIGKAALIVDTRIYAFNA